MTKRRKILYLGSIGLLLLFLIGWYAVAFIFFRQSVSTKFDGERAYNDVKTQAWANIYADRLDNMAMIATEMNDLETARRLTMDAANLRGVNKEKSDPLPDGLLDRRVIVYVMDPEKLGIPKVDRRNLAEFIDKIDITESEKLKLRRDAQVEDVAFELVENEQ